MSAKGKRSSKHHRTQTGARAASRRHFTESLRGREPAGKTAQKFATLVIGDLIGGVFRIVSLIGEGGMGSVYLVEHQSLCKQFALKVMRPDSVNTESWQRFKAEAQTIASFNHSTFVKVYDLGVHENSLPFYSMDYLKGRSVEHVLVADGPLMEAQAIDIYLEILEGLAYAHRNGIVHRDLKPANIMLCLIDGEPVVKILDFGISKLIGDTTGRAQQLTIAGDIFGSPFYMSPEQCDGGKIDARSDIYSLGCSLFETLTGYVPFDGDNSVDTMLMHKEDEPPVLEDMLASGVFSEGINLVIAKCLAKSPADRYQSAKELSVDLVRVKEGRDLLSYSQNYPRRLARTKHQSENSDGLNSAKLFNHPVRIGLLILAVTIIIAGVCALTFVSRQKSSATGEPEKAASNSIAKIEILGDSMVAHWRQEVAELERRYGPNDPRVANKMTEIGTIFREQEDYVQAEQVYLKLEKIYRTTLGAEHEYRVDTLNNLALCCQHQNRFDEAERYYKEILALMEKRKGDHSREIARELNWLGTMYRLQKKYDLAESAYKRSIKLDPNNRSNSSYRSSRVNYAFLLKATNRDKEAAKLESEDAQISGSSLPTKTPTARKLEELMAE